MAAEQTAEQKAAADKAAGEKQAADEKAKQEADAKATAEQKAAADKASTTKTSGLVVLGPVAVLPLTSGGERYVYRGTPVGDEFTKEGVKHAQSVGLVGKPKK